MLSPEQLQILTPYWIFKEEPQGIDFYLIEPAKDFGVHHPDLLKTVLQECDAVERTVWNKRFSLLHSTFELDSVTLMIHQQNIIGFLSLSFFDLPLDTIGFYLSEIMILPSFHNRGLSKTAVEKTLSQSRRSMDAFNKTRRQLLITLSGNIALFKAMKGVCESLPLPLQSIEGEIRQAIVKYLERDTVSHSVSEQGIVRGVWSQQTKGPSQPWPEKIAKNMGLPVDIQFEQGDAVVGIFPLRFNFPPVETSACVR